MSSNDRPYVLAILPALYTSTVINVVKPLLQLHLAAKIQMDISFESLVTPSKLAWADVVIFCRNIEPEYGHLLELAFTWGKPIIYDLDDNLLEAPDSTPGLRYFRHPERQAQLKKYLTQANLVRVYAPALQRYLASYNSNVFKVNGPLDWKLVPSSFPPRTSQRVRLVYATARLEDEIGEMLVNSILRILNTFPQVELTIWGPQLKALQRQPGVRHLNVIMDYDAFFYKFARQRFDIGLAPLPDDLFHRCKTNVKFREFAACQIAGVYSNIEVYSECVENGITGLLVGSDEVEWFTAIARLIEDLSLRENIQRQAQTFARQHYNHEQMQADWLAHIQQVLAASPQIATSQLQGGGPVKNIISTTSDTRPAALATGVLNQALRYSTRIVPMLKERGLYVTLGRIRLHLSSFKQLISLKIKLWHLQHQQSKEQKLQQ
ncbi:MAG: glycosyltransferase [Anaerolineales bacterium]|nr:glycosyltransferase [Anaerolineales bacterium]